MLACALCACALSGCGQAPDAPEGSDGARSAPKVTAVPEEGEHGEEDQSRALESLPTLEPVETYAPSEAASGASDDYYSIDALLNPPADDDGAPTPQPQAGGVIDPNTYQFSALIDTSLGFTFNYPSHWENVPGVFTVCYREKVEPGDFPARIAITAKKLAHSPEGTVLSDELTSYMHMVHKQYSADRFQVGTPNGEDSFMGKQAYSNTYLAYSGETEIKGFVIGRAVKRTLYVLHFCATYEDYAAMESMMRYMVRSVELVEPD